ncbi:MAG: hypothetical protein J6X69_01880 [Bacteroidales bacterium]|nr:hypothetical protein [Bacteroidales bacterium]
MKKVLKIVAAVFGSVLAFLLVLTLVVQWALSEKALTRIVNRYAVEFVDADVHFGSIYLSLWKDFPHWSVQLEDVVLTYPSDRFAREDSIAYTLSRMAYSGKQGYYRQPRRRGANVPGAAPSVSRTPVVPVLDSNARDTLASIASLKVVLKASDFWEHGTLHVPFIELSKPHIYAKDYGGKVNWDIFKSDTTSVADTSESGLSLPVIHINRIRLKDNPRVFYCSVQDTLFASMRAKEILLRSNIRTDSLHQLRGKLTIDSLFVAGRMKKDTVFFGLHNFSLQRRSDTVTVEASARSALALASIGRTRVPIELAASIIRRDSAYYFLNLDRFELSAFDIPFKAQGTAWTNQGKMGVDMRLGTADEKRFYTSLKATSKPVGKSDALYQIDASFTSDLKGLLALSPEKLPIDLDGVLNASLKGNIRQSQLSVSEFAKADLEGKFFARHLAVAMPADTIDAAIDSLDIRLGASGRQFREGGKKRRLLTLTVGMDSLQVLYKQLFDVNGKNLELRIFNSANVLIDKERQAFYPFSGLLDIGRLRLKDSDGMVAVLRDGKESFSVRPKRGQRQTPVLTLKSHNGRILYKSGADRMRIRQLNLDVRAEMNTIDRARRREAFLDTLALRYPDVSRDSLFRHWVRSQPKRTMPDFLSEKDFREKDLHFSLPGTFEKYFKEWDLNGTLSMGRLTMVTPRFPLKTDVSAMGGSFNNNTIILDSLKVLSGKSDLKLSGKVDGLRRFLAARGPVLLDACLQSQEIDGDELMAAWQTGRSISEEERDRLSALDDDSFDKQVAEIKVEKVDTVSELMVVPANVIANIKVAADEIRYSGLEFMSVNLDLDMRERTARITNTMATSNVGNVFFEGFYSTRTKKDLKAGLNLSLVDVTAERVIELFPALDTLMPLLSNFSGLLSCDLAMTSEMDTHMNFIIPTAKGVIRIEGSDLQIYDTPQFTKLAKVLMFKNKNVGYVDNLRVEGRLENSKIEIFPFALKIDRYSLAMSGIQNVSSDFNYHISVIKSPVLIKFGVDLWGNFDDWKFSLCKPRYKSLSVPAFSTVIDEGRISLSRSIGSIFNIGADKVLSDDRISQQLQQTKMQQGYSTSVSRQELSAEEKAQLKEQQ